MESLAPILEVDDLHVRYKLDDETVYALNGVSLSINKGETLGIVGETGAGKTTLALSILRLLPKVVGEISKGSIRFDGEEILELPEGQMRLLRGNKIAMIFQDPMTSLNPVQVVGNQIAEVLNLHTDLSKTEIDDKVDSILSLVGIDPVRKTNFPHQFSGGMKQRIVIAIALACSPELLIADEPTTALDVTIQTQVLAMIEDIQQEFGTSLILITHDLGIVAEMCDNVAIFYAGEIVEYGTLAQIFDESAIHHPYTIGLFGSIPSFNVKQSRLRPIAGLMPDPTIQPAGCRFFPRCAEAGKICEECPAPVVDFDGHKISCHMRTGDNGDSQSKE